MPPARTGQSTAACPRIGRAPGAVTRRLVERTLLTALAHAERVADVRAGAAFLEPQRSLACPAALVYEPTPVQVVEMAPAAAADEPHRDDRLALAVLVAKAAAVEMVPPHQPAAAPLRVRGDVLASLTMNQVGKMRAPTGATWRTFSSWRGGVYRSSAGTPSSRCSLATRRGSSILSRRRCDQS